MTPSKCFYFIEYLPSIMRSMCFHATRPVLGTGVAAPQILFSVLGLSLQESHGSAGASSEKGNRVGGGSGVQVL